MKTIFKVAASLSLMSVAVVSNASGTISGKVLSEGGKAEAGVWVVAETQSLQTDYRKIVVTDGEGRFLLPDLPPADYSVWVRGYGVEDSAKASAKPGATLDIQVSEAGSAVEAASALSLK